MATDNPEALQEFATEIQDLNKKVRESINALETTPLTTQNTQMILALEEQAFERIKNLMVSVNALLAYLGHDDPVPDFGNTSVSEFLPEMTTLDEPLEIGEESMIEFEEKRQMRHVFYKNLRTAAFQQFADDNDLTFEEVEEGFEKGRIVVTIHKNDEDEYNASVAWR